MTAWPPVARSDMSMIGVWKDDIRIDQAAVAAYTGGELKPKGGGANVGKLDVEADVVGTVPHPVHDAGRQRP